jgi:hypothetical protein
MKTNTIPLESIKPKNKMKIKLENSELHIPAEEANLGKSRHHVSVPGKYIPPFRINMTLTSKFAKNHPITPQFRLYIGKGNVYFNGGHTSCTDILTFTKSSVFGDNKAANYVYYNNIPDKGYVDISIMFGSKMMWVSVDGVYCYFSDKLAYIEMLKDNDIPNEFKEGVDIVICGGTDTKLVIKSLIVTEYENDEPKIPEELLKLPKISAFEMYVQGLPPKIQEIMYDMDAFLMNDMKGYLKFKRTIDKYGHLTYASPGGFQYGIREFGVGGYHGTAWVQSPKKPDLTNEIMNELAKKSPEFAEKIFGQFQFCHPHTRECSQRTRVEFKSKTVDVCMSKITFQMTPSGFEDVKKYITAVGEAVKKENKK